MKKKGKTPKLFIGLEETNITEFISPCCEAGLSIEPLCNICCGICGKNYSNRQDELIYDIVDKDYKEDEEKAEERDEKWNL